jgi:hypothetical protein
VKICVAAMEALRKGKKKDKGETQEPSKLTVFF